MRADPYRDQVRSVAKITVDGSSGCTGSLLNNTARDFKPYVLAARHCFGHDDARQAARVVVYWNCQRTECGGGQAPTDQTQSGAILRAEWAASDTVLLELDDEPDAAFNVYFAGWNRGASPPTSAVSIHHPRGHYKSFAVENDALTVTRWLENTAEPGGGYLRVGAWEQGAVEPGSSGAPLFDEHKRIVGQLHGGMGRCSRPDMPVWFGRLAEAWSGGGSASNRLSDWLDPAGAGVTVLDGMILNAGPRAVGTLDAKAIRLADGAVTGAVTVDVAVGLRDSEGDDMTYSATSSDELASAFLDVDGDALTYEASSSDVFVATVSVWGSTVTVRAGLGGLATITVGATDVDGSNTRTRQTFDAVVASRPPVAVGSLPGLTTRSGESSAHDVSGFFSDPREGGTVTVVVRLNRDPERVLQAQRLRTRFAGPGGIARLNQKNPLRCRHGRAVAHGQGDLVEAGFQEGCRPN